MLNRPQKHSSPVRHSFPIRPSASEGGSDGGFIIHTSSFPIDCVRVRKLAELQCTDKEIASLLACDPAVFRRQKEKDKRLREALKKGRADGKMYLRFTQLKAAHAGKATVLIQLGRQSLGQTDTQAHEAKAEQSSRLDHLIAMIDATAQRSHPTHAVPGEGEAPSEPIPQTPGRQALSNSNIRNDQ